MGQVALACGGPQVSVSLWPCLGVPQGSVPSLAVQRHSHKCPSLDVGEAKPCWRLRFQLLLFMCLVPHGD